MAPNVAYLNPYNTSTDSLFVSLTIIGIPWGKQHFKMAGLSLAPFGKDVELGL